MRITGYVLLPPPPKKKNLVLSQFPFQTESLVLGVCWVGEPRGRESAWS